MRITINGDPHDLGDGATVGEAVHRLTAQATGIAVAVNDEVVSRGAWDATVLADGDRVEVLTAVQGG
ncbi:sulfur carrier protein ThiS [Herbidospora galbida]|uniref:Sulfur carrier protein ThiS n=1 Tax=Herbidospora galbida TaxID=2575442 RepID=A0A4U3M9A8_9ACTN|nr:sulfur carrier protein ThiS [Herbidospora galbida]TKK84849.1 sulfur carrier protein ThiS [Herbidospora galbida]